MVRVFALSKVSGALRSFIGQKTLSVLDKRLLKGFYLNDHKELEEE
jgi:hypothetical protein